MPKALRERDPTLLAPLIGLVATDDAEPGVRRIRCGRGFRFVDPDGNTVRSPERQRLVDLAVPPAWDDVWLCPLPLGYLQATGRDAAERKQYRYHDEYRRLRDQQKFDRLRYFPRALKTLRRATAEWLEDEPGSETLALGAALRLIDVGLVRIGNEASASNDHHGATTLEAEHAQFEPDEGYVELQYTAKGGKARSVVIEDDQLVEVLQTLADPDAERLLWYDDSEGQPVRVRPEAINRAIAELVGPAFTAKDFRTWGGSRVALEARAGGATDLEAIDAAAETLGNTRAVARSAYVHPAVSRADQKNIERYWRASRSSRWRSRGDSALQRLLSETPPLLS